MCRVVSGRRTTLWRHSEEGEEGGEAEREGRTIRKGGSDIFLRFCFVRAEGARARHSMYDYIIHISPGSRQKPWLLDTQVLRPKLCL